MNNETFRIVGSVLLKDSEFISGLKSVLNEAENTTQQLAQKFESVGNSLNKIGQGITKAGTVMTGTLTAGIGGLVGAGIKYNAELETFQMNLTTLLGSSDKATKLLNDLQAMASTTPFETTDLISATQTMIGFGISAQDSQKYLSVLGDIAMGDSEKLKGLSLAFSQVQSTGKLTGQDLLQMINQGFNPLLYISKMTGKSMATLKEEMGEGKISAKMVGDAFEYATQKGQPFYQAMENGAETVNGRISTLKDNFMIMIGNLTESLLPIFEKVVDKLIELTEKFSNLSDEQKEQVLKWGAIIASIGPVLMILGKLVSGLGSVFTIIGKVKGMGGLAGLATKFSALLPVIGPVIGVIAGVVAGIAVLVHVLGGPKEALEKLKQAFEKVKEVIATFLERIDFKDKIEGIKNKLSEFGEKLKGLKDLFKVIGTVVGATLVPTIAILSGAFNAILVVIEPLITAIGGIIDILAGLGSFIVGIFTGDLKKCEEAILKMGQGIADVFGGLWDAIVGFLVGFVEGVIEFFVSLWDTLVGHSIVPDMINAIIDWFKNLLGKPIQFVKDLVSKVIKFFTDLKNKAVNVVLALFNGIKDRFNAIKSTAISIFNAMKTLIVNIFNNIKEGIQARIQLIKNVISNVFNTIKSIASSIWNGIKTVIINPIKNAFSTIKTVVKNIKNNFVNTFNSVKTKVTSIFNKVKEGITKPVEKARDAVKKVVDKIKGFFDFKFKLPSIKVPKFSVSPKGWKVGDLLDGKIPKLSVKWNADGAIFDKATIFDTRNGLQGVGEAGPEAVAPISKLQDYVQVAVQNSNSGLEEKLDTLINVLTSFLPQITERQLVLSTGELVGALTNPMDKALAERLESKRRGR